MKKAVHHNSHVWGLIYVTDTNVSKVVRKMQCNKVRRDSLLTWVPDFFNILYRIKLGTPAREALPWPHVPSCDFFVSRFMVYHSTLFIRKVLNRFARTSCFYTWINWTSNSLIIPGGKKIKCSALGSSKVAELSLIFFFLMCVNFEFKSMLDHWLAPRKEINTLFC